MPERNTAWRCGVCGYIHRGPEPPGSCPICGASRADFEPIHLTGEGGSETAEAMSVVVLGAGAAGIAAAESLRAATSATKIVLISQEKEHPYYRLNLTRYLAGEVDREQLVIHPPEWYDEQNIQLLLGTEVCRLHLEDHAVELRDGNQIRFEKLLLASGAHPFVPDLPGTDCGGVTMLRTVHDADYILDSCGAGARCVCIGGGILGLETAAALARRGVDVTLLESHDWLMPRQLNPQAGAILADHVRRLGVKLVEKAVTREVVGEGKARGVLLEDGSRIPAELVVIATGIRANSSLARQAGLKVNRGVLVDNHLKSSHPDVLAAGDIAEHDGVVYGLWTVSQAQGAIAGMNLAGASAEFGGLPRFNTLKVLGLDLVSMGQIMPKDPRDHVIEKENDGRYCCFLFRENRLAGAILLADLSLMSVAKKAVESNHDFSSFLQDRPTADRVMDYLREAGIPSEQTGGARSAFPQTRSAPIVRSAEKGVVTRLRCPTCGYAYDEEEEKRKWSELPEDWLCPVCGGAGPSFEPVGREERRPVWSVLGRFRTAHRAFGYAFLGIYIVLMWQMVPRLWGYQIEFPARTVVHMSLGMAIGAILFLKIAVVRFFRRLDADLVPAFGTSLVVASVVLVGIAVPPAFREALARGRVFEKESRQRVEGLLIQTGLDETQSALMVTPKSLRAGQRVLRQRCVECHDLRTVLAQPRTPESWRQTVRRMAERTMLFDPLTEQEQWQVTAYLVALSPQLQRSVGQLREQQEQRNETKQATADMSAENDQSSSYDPALAKRLFEAKCSACHDTTLVEETPPDTEEAAKDLIMRMVEEGLTARDEELSQILRYLIETYVSKSAP